MTYAQAFPDPPSTKLPNRPGPRASLASLVVSQLVDDIVAGRFPTDAALPREAELGERFGVSRTVVREAVKLLQVRGLVRSHQGVGTVVQQFEGWDLIDDEVLTALVRHDRASSILDELVSVRAGLERDMAAAAATAPGGLAEVRAAYAEMLASQEDQAAFGRADVAFHDAIMRRSGNRLGRVIVNRIHAKARLTDRYHGTVTPAMISLTLAEHEQILRAMALRDAQIAAASMYAHIAGSWRRRRPDDDAATAGLDERP